MKKINSILIITLLMISLSLSFCSKKTEEVKDSKPKAFQWYNFDEGLKLAKEENKLIFINFFISKGCKECEHMDKEVFSDKEIQDLMMKDFIPIKMNAESKTKINYSGIQLPEYEVVKKYLGMRLILPTYMFLDKEAKIVNRLEGFQIPNQFKAILKEMSEVKS